MMISLRAGSRIYINGALLKVDRKVSIELVNDAAFLLESNILNPDQADTPFKQLYYVIQSLLVQPKMEKELLPLFRSVFTAVCQANYDPLVLDRLQKVDQNISKKRFFDALKHTRKLFAMEGSSSLIGSQPAQQKT